MSNKIFGDGELDTAEKAAERERMMKEFLAKGGKIEKIPYGVTHQDLGTGNSNNFYDPPATITPKTTESKRKLKKKTKN